MRTEVLLGAALLFGCLSVGKDLGGASVRSGEAPQHYDTTNSQLSRTPCDRLPGPWIVQDFVPIEANVRTTVSIEAESSSIAFVLFDNILDRRCTIAFTRQPQFWQSLAVSDSCLSLPLPPLPSGVYRLTVKTADTTYVEKWVVMK